MAALDAPSTTISQRKAKYSQACDFCRAKKVRCEGSYPCKQCVDHFEECVFSAKKRGTKRTKPGHETVSQRLQRLESMIKSSSASGEGTLHSSAVATSEQDVSPSRLDSFPAQGSVSQVDSGSPIRNQVTQQMNTPLSHWSPSPLLNTTLETGRKEILVRPTSHHGHYHTDHDVDRPQVSSLLETPPSDNISAMSTTIDTTISHVDRLPAPAVDSGTSITTTDPQLQNLDTQEDSSLRSNEMTSWEYNGPRCILSICSQPGINWVESRVKAPGVKESILRFATDVTRRMKVEPGCLLQSKQRTPEPPHNVARLYTNVFFERSFEAATGMIDRAWFDNKLTAYSNGTKYGLVDPSWYAIYNTVLAFGCRITLVKTQSYSQAVEAAKSFFDNALSVQSDILQCRSSIISVRALVLMASFTEAIGSPHLEYMLASNAMRLAISKGLHRQPAASWNVSEQEIRQRNRLFWNIYAMDRQISHRSGRPPAIDDDDISCQLPETSSPGETINITFTTTCVKLHQILSHAYKRLSSARALRQSTAELVKSVTELDQEVVAFKRSIEHLIALDEPLDELRILLPMTTFQLTMIYFLYYGLLFEIHSPLMLPWFNYTGLKQFEAFQSQVDYSCATVAKTARAAILGTRLVRLDANCPVQLATYIPHRAVIHLFTYILRDPTADTVQSDLKLMEIAAGYSSRVELASDGSISASFTREFTNFAYAAVDRARLSQNEAGPNLEPKDARAIHVDCADSNADVNLPSDDPQYFQEFFDPNFEMDMELWSSLVPVTSFEEIDMNTFAS